MEGSNERKRPAQTEDRRSEPLPITAEVGGEGGSFADATYQVATFGDQAAPHTVDRERIQHPDPDDGMIRRPTEPPAPPSATEGWKARPRWRSTAIAAAAGAAGAALVMLFRNRRDSLVPEGRQRIDASGPARGDVAGRQRDNTEE